MSLATNPMGTEDAASTQVKRRPTWILCTIIAIAFFLAPCGVINHGDGEARYAQTKALLLYNRLSIPPELAYTKNGDPIGNILMAPNGQRYCKYGIGTSLVWLIPTSVAWIIHRSTGADLDTVAGFGISFVNPILAAATVWSLCWALRRLTVGRHAQLITVLLYLFGTSALAYANTAFSEPLVGLLLFWAAILPVIDDDVKAALVSGVLLTCCTLVKPELALLPACLLPLFVGKQRRRALIAFCMTAALGALFLALNNLVCRGSPTQFSYGDETFQFQSPLIGLTQQFYGIKRNLLLFNPALLLALTGWVVLYRTARWRRLLVACLLVWVVYLPFYSSWYEWDGGMCFGPRFFQSFIPFTLLPGGFGLLWLAANARYSVWYGVVGVALCGFVLAIVPLQVAGLCIKNEEAVHISEITGRSEPWTHIQLMALKLRRGIRHPEIYHKSDFTRLAAGEPDTVMDFRSKTTFQYLNHWWSIYLANKLRNTNSRGLLSGCAP